MSRKRLLIAGWVLALGLSALLPLSAVFHGVIHVGARSLVIGTRLNKPFITLGSNVMLRQGSSAPIVSLFGDVRVQGRSSDDLVVIGGNTYLLPGSRVDGDVLSALGTIYRSPRSVANGRLGGAVRSWGARSPIHATSRASLLMNNVKLGAAAGLALLLIGTCLTIVFPWQVVLIASTLRAEGTKSVAAGLTNLLIFIFLVVPLALSLAGLPFAILLTGAAVLAWLFGLTASGVLLGRWLARGPVSLVWATAAGLVVIACSMAIPVIGPLLITVIGLAGTGALAVALLSRSRPAMPLP